MKLHPLTHHAQRLAALREVSIDYGGGVVCSGVSFTVTQGDRVALCDGGKILAVDTPQGVVGRFDEPLYALAGDDMYGLLLEARRHADVKECYPFGQTHHLIAGEGFDAGRFVRETTARGFRRVTLRPVGAGIEDVFIKLMRHA